MLCSLTLMLTLAAAQLGASGSPHCEEAADAALHAARAQVQADFWHATALAMLGPPDDALAAFLAAREARAAGLALAEAQRAARARVCGLLGHGAHPPRLSPSDFSAHVDAQWFPLPPGRRMVYERATAEGLERIVVVVRVPVVTIAGVSCRAVETTQTLGGTLVESATEFYAQRLDGSVWAFGELARQHEGEWVVSMEGSWRAGVGGAWPGMQQPADPALGVVFRMQHALGVAEDVGRIVATGVTVTVPAGTFQDCIGVEEWSPLEPDDVVVKYYAPGVGWVLEENAVDGSRTELVQAD